MASRQSWKSKRKGSNHLVKRTFFKLFLTSNFDDLPFLSCFTKVRVLYFPLQTALNNSKWKINEIRSRFINRGYIKDLVKEILFWISLVWQNLTVSIKMRSSEHLFKHKWFKKRFSCTICTEKLLNFGALCSQKLQVPMESMYPGDEDWNPWQVKVVHPSNILVDKFQSWGSTSAKPRLKAWHRAQKWVSDIIRVPFTPPHGHAKGFWQG